MQENKIWNGECACGFCGVLYVLKSSYEWRMLPKHFFKRENAAMILCKNGARRPVPTSSSLLEQFLKKLLGKGLQHAGSEKRKHVFALLTHKGYDAGKKKSFMAHIG